MNRRNDTLFIAAHVSRLKTPVKLVSCPQAFVLWLGRYSLLLHRLMPCNDADSRPAARLALVSFAMRIFLLARACAWG